MNSTSSSEPTLGEYLRQEREKLGISIEQIASATKINVRILHQLENDEYMDLPAKPFIRGFVTSYMRFLGGDPDKVLNIFDSFIDLKTNDRPVKDKGHSGYAFERRDTERSRTILWVVMAGFVALGGIAIFVLKPALRHKPNAQVIALKKDAPKNDTPVMEGPKLPPGEETGETTSEQLSDTSDAEDLQKPQEAQAEGEDTGTTTVADAGAEETNTSVIDSAQNDEDEDEETPPGQSADPNRIPKDTDILNKGDSLPAESIRHRVILKALNDVWIRYRVDGRTNMKVKLLKDRLLILRAAEAIRLQVSEPSNLAFRYRKRGYLNFNLSKHVQMINSTPTITFPYGLINESGNPFPGTPPLTPYED